MRYKKQTIKQKESGTSIWFSATFINPSLTSLPIKFLIVAIVVLLLGGFFGNNSDIWELLWLFCANLYLTYVWWRSCAIQFIFHWTNKRKVKPEWKNQFDFYAERSFYLLRIEHQISYELLPLHTFFILHSCPLQYLLKKYFQAHQLNLKSKPWI